MNDEIKKYKVIGEIEGFEKDSVISEEALPVEDIEKYVSEGSLEEVVDGEDAGVNSDEGDEITTGTADEGIEATNTTGTAVAEDQDFEEQEEKNEEPVPAPKTLGGKNIFGVSTREVNGKTYHTVRLEDGTTQDLTDEEYEEKILSQDK